MVETAFVPDCSPPGSQGSLFDLPNMGRSRFRVIGSDGKTHAATNSLGVAVTAAEHLVVVGAVAWISATDGTTARLDASGIASSTPDRPWIRTVAASLHRKDTNP
jgi:hypothetical protein